MRWSARLTATVIAGGLAVAAVPAQAAPPAGTVALYTFDTHRGTTVVDSSANRFHGTLHEADPATAYVPGRPGHGRALALVGEQGQFFSVADRPRLDLDRFTLAAQIRYTGVQNPDTGGRWEVLEKAGAYWMNVRTTGRLRAGGFFGGCGADRHWKYLDSSRAVPVGTWVHVAATYDGSRLRLYLDGRPAGSRAVSGRTCANAEPLAVGAKYSPRRDLAEAFFDGLLDDVHLLGRAMTPAQVAALAG
jgi:hypothetical protein